MRAFLTTAMATAMMFLIGCAKPAPWSHRINTGRAIQADRAECSAQAGQARRCWHWKEVFNDCMCGKGYSSEAVKCE